MKGYMVIPTWLFIIMWLFLVIDIIMRVAEL
jgi:hypothetical protein